MRKIASSIAKEVKHFWESLRKACLHVCVCVCVCEGERESILCVCVVKCEV